MTQLTTKYKPLSTLPMKKAQGFSLIELMIVIAIMGILAAVAYPSYGEYVRKAGRADGHLGLFSAVQELERCKSTSFSYTGCTLAKTTSPEDNYTLSVAVTATTFTVTATAKGAQLKDTLCPTLTLSDLGVQGHTGTGPCWN